MLMDAYMNQTVTLKKLGNIDKFGKSNVVDKEIKCKITFENKVLINSDGTQITSTAKILTKEPDVKTEDILFYENREYKIISVTAVTNIDGKVEYYKILV